MTLLCPETRTLEVHPVPFTRLLNRIPSSGQREWDHLGGPLLPAAVADAAALGYTTLHIGGKDPLHWPATHPLCAEAHRQGITTSLQLPQSQLNGRLLEELQGSIDHLSVVLERRPVAGGRLRTCPQIRRARQLGMGITVILNVTPTNLKDLEGAAQFAAAHDAGALVIRTWRLSEEDVATAWMMVELLRDLCRGRLQLGFESPNRYCLPAPAPEIDEWQQCLTERPHSLADVISPLVIESDGVAVPLFNGLPRRLAFGDLHRESLRDLAASWAVHRSATFARCYRNALTRLQEETNHHNDFFELLSEEAVRGSGAALAAAG